MKSYHTFQCSHALIPIHNLLSTQIMHFAEMFILSNIEMIFTQIKGFAQRLPDLIQDVTKEQPDLTKRKNGLYT